mgnify:CR=1 FL=1
MKKFLILVVLLLSFAIVATAYGATGYPWRSHAAPYNHEFGNHIDTHQQSKLNRRGQLGGFFYIKFTGTETADGDPVAEHAKCDKTPDDCSVGWKLKGVPVQAKLLAKPDGEHPQWCVEAKDIPQSPGYSHFHWLGPPEHAGDLKDGDIRDGYLLKLTAVDKFWFDHHGGFLVTPGIDTETHANVESPCPE